jgi:hypothetical protein
MVYFVVDVADHFAVMSNQFGAFSPFFPGQEIAQDLSAFPSNQNMDETFSAQTWLWEPYQA